VADAYICKTCGVQYAPSDEPPAECIICQDERQYVGPGGQQWTTLDEMRSGEYRNLLREHEPGLTGIGTTPFFGIGQRALLVQTPAGNVLWDCITYLDDETIEAVRALGGIQAISMSHPHFYGTAAEWALAFDADVYYPKADEQWITRRDSRTRLWSDTEEIMPGVTLVETGGHFEGSAVLHWAEGADGRGAILTGDTIAVAQDRRWVTFMRSYPNYMPLPASAIRAIVEAVRPYAFDRIYGGWWLSVVDRDGKESVEQSAQRYIELITAEDIEESRRNEGGR
jgi:glyoxylase-like metal-dependent hydrolase (beta-lactamase superfamily II)